MPIRDGAWRLRQVPGPGDSFGAPGAVLGWTARPGPTSVRGLCEHMGAVPKKCHAAVRNGSPSCPC
eukprot:6937867-Alexandrium_andersonii.AAC.1